MCESRRLNRFEEIKKNALTNKVTWAHLYLKQKKKTNYCNCIIKYLKILNH